MAYSKKTKLRVKYAGQNLGAKLGRWAIHLDLSVMRVSELLGATRQTVYNWMFGGTVTNAYRDRVKELVEITMASDSADDAYNTAKERFFN